MRNHERRLHTVAASLAPGPDTIAARVAAALDRDRRDVLATAERLAEAVTGAPKLARLAEVAAVGTGLAPNELETRARALLARMDLA